MSAPETIKVLDLYQAQERIHPRAVAGRFNRLRVVLRWLAVALLAGVPWLRWDGRQAVLVDLEARRLQVFDLLVFPQDLSLAAWLLIIAALGLFTITAWAGRVWCGYACPQSVWSAMFFGIEQWLEGRPAKRQALDAAPWGAHKLALRGAKYSLFLLLSLATGFSITAWFNPAPELLRGMLAFELGGGVTFWLLFLTAATFAAGGLLREQVCFYMCPYARFQAAMFDQDTLVISYDPARGEPRGRGRRHAQDTGAGAAAAALGDCVDCSLCVQVCPSGIDIRDGLQYECISCGLCIDACDSVMDRVGAPRGLIRYTTERALTGSPGRRLHPKMLGYGAVLLVVCAVFAAMLWQREPVQLDVFRDRQQLFRTVETSAGTVVRNSFRLRLTNRTAVAARYTLAVTALTGDTALRLTAPAAVAVPAGALQDVSVQVEVATADIARGVGAANSSVAGSSSLPVRFTATLVGRPGVSTDHDARLMLPAGQP